MEDFYMAYKFQLGAAVLSGSIKADDGIVSTDVDDATAANIIAQVDAGEIPIAKLAANTISGIALGANLNSLSKATNGGVNFSAYNGSAAVADLALDLSDLAAAAVNVGADSIAIYDADADVTGKESIADLATAMAGDGLAASSGVFSVGVDDSSVEINADALRVKAAGITNTMLSGAIANAKLQNSTISGVSLGSNLNSLSKATNGGVSFTSYNGSAAVADLQLDLSDLAAAAVDASADSIAIIDATDDSTKKESIADLAAAMASGTGIVAASGQFAVDGVLEDLDALGAASTDGEFIVATGAGAFAYESGNTARTSLGLGTGDSPQFTGLTLTGDLTVQGTTTTIDSTTINISSSFTFEGVADDYETTLNIVDPSADRTVSLPNQDGVLAILSPSLSDSELATAITAAPSEINLLDAGAGSSVSLADGDGFIMFDATDSDNAKKVLLSDIKSYVSDAAQDVAIKADGDTLAVGVNYFADMSSDGEDSVTLPASPDVGQSVKVKAPSDCSEARYITISRAGSQTIDGATSIRLESPFAAVELVYVASNLWRVF
jgi:hypothetical protein